LNEIGLASFGVLIQPLQMRGIPPAYKVKFGWPAGGASTHNPQSVSKRRPIFGAGFGWLKIKKRLYWLIGLGQVIQQTCGGGRTGTGKQLDDAEAGYPITQILRPTQKRKDVLNMCDFKKLQAAVFHKRDIASRQFQLKLSTVMGGAEQHRLLL
jgi:hypothetical protein